MNEAERLARVLVLKKGELLLARGNMLHLTESDVTPIARAMYALGNPGADPWQLSEREVCAWSLDVLEASLLVDPNLSEEKRTELRADIEQRQARGRL